MTTQTDAPKVVVEPHPDANPDPNVQRIGLEYFDYVKAMRSSLRELGINENVAEALIAKLTKHGFIWEKV